MRVQSKPPFEKLTSRFKVEHRLKAAWAVPIQVFSGLIIGVLPVGGILLDKERDTLMILIIAGGLIGLTLIALQIFYTINTKAWYGSISSPFAFALFLPWTWAGWSSQFANPASAAWISTVPATMMLISGLWHAWFDFVAWPLEARRRGLALDAVAPSDSLVKR